MSYQKFIHEQTALTDISLAYKNDPEFQKHLDANPKAIFRGEMGAELLESECEIIIKHNSDEVFYFILSANVNQILDDEEVDSINAAKLEHVGSSRDSSSLVYKDPSSGKLYRRYKGDPSDPFGHTHFIESVGRGSNHRFVGYFDKNDTVVVLDV